MCLKKILFLFLLLLSCSCFVVGQDITTSQLMESTKDLLLLNISDLAIIRKSSLQTKEILTNSNNNLSLIDQITIDLQMRLQEKDNTIESMKSNNDKLKKQADAQKKESEKLLKESKKQSIGLKIVNVIEGIIILALISYSVLK